MKNVKFGLAKENHRKIHAAEEDDNILILYAAFYKYEVPYSILNQKTSFKVTNNGILFRAKIRENEAKK
uniref:Uncharacterized protein n=1 Tax=Onchocerca volvulus TaxID=6282 RepID=A0A8R1XKR8_ONCVO